MLLSSVNAPAIAAEHVTLRNRLIAAGQKAFVGVLRPPLPPSRFWGVALGLVHETGQVQFTFTNEEARSTCSSALALRSLPGLSLIKPDAYRYKIGARDVVPCVTLND